MKEDPIIEEIRRHRAEHAKKYGYDLNRICAALREIESEPERRVVYRKPRPLVARRTEV